MTSIAILTEMPSSFAMKFLLLTLVGLPSSGLAAQATLMRGIVSGGDRLVGETPSAISPASSSSEAAEIRVTGGPINSSVSFAFPTRVTLTNGGSSFNLTLTSTPSNKRLTFNSTGAASIFLGGQFPSIPTTYPRGNYTGNFPVTIQGVSSSVSVSVRVALQQGILLITNNNMRFGEVVQGDLLATISPSQGGRAWLTVRGEPNRAYQLTFATTQVTLTRNGSGSGAGILVNNFQAQHPGSLNAQGNAEVYVGGTRGSIGNSLAPGPYSGTLRITVQY